MTSGDEERVMLAAANCEETPSADSREGAWGVWRELSRSTDVAPGGVGTVDAEAWNAWLIKLEVDGDGCGEGEGRVKERASQACWGAGADWARGG